MSAKQPVWSWTDAVMKSDVQPLTKFVCLNIARYFSSAGKGWRISVKDMMRDTGLSNRSMATHLQLAANAKLLIIKRELGPHGQRGVTTYVPRFPDGTELKQEAEIAPSESASPGPREPSSPGPSEPASLRPSEPGSRQVSSQSLPLQETPPTPSARGRPRKPKSFLSEDWTLPDAWREWASAHSPARALWISAEADKFRDHWLSVDGRKADWEATWRNWWRRACEQAPSQQGLPGRRTKADEGREFLESLGIPPQASQ